MAVTRLGSIARFQGASTDTKPSGSIGDEFFETDTGRIYKYDGSNWKILSGDIDQKVYSGCAIDIAHHEIHEGDHYETTYTETVGTGTAVTCMITAPGTTETHIVVDVQSSNSGSYTWSEAPNASGGSAITAIANNRIESTTAESSVVSGVTYTSAGTILQNDILGGTTQGNRAVGGMSVGRREWILNNSVLYLVRFTADNASTEVVINLSWYEVR